MGIVAEIGCTVRLSSPSFLRGSDSTSGCTVSIPNCNNKEEGKKNGLLLHAIHLQYARAARAVPVRAGDGQHGLHAV